MSTFVHIFAAPVRDYLAALRACLEVPRLSVVVVLVASIAASWFLYVPVHELLHAFGCIAAGGEVKRLEIDAVYGARLLQAFFPFVAVGSEYAGQLVDFDTRGNDLVYLATDALPFALTVFPGVPLIRSAANATSALRAAIGLGIAVPLAYAPFISLPGDYYEMGSILVSRGVHRWSPEFPVERWRSDDVFLLAERLFGSGGNGTPGDGAGVLAAFVLGTVLAFATYALGTLVADLLVRKR